MTWVHRTDDCIRFFILLVGRNLKKMHVYGFGPLARHRGCAASSTTRVACTFVAVHKKESCDFDHKARLAALLLSAQFLTGATAMAGRRWTSKRRALVIVTITLVYAAFLRVAAPKVVSFAELGGWQCTQSLFLVTTCTQIRQPFTGTAPNPHDEVVSRDDD